MHFKVRNLYRAWSNQRTCYSCCQTQDSSQLKRRTTIENRRASSTVIMVDARFASYTYKNAALSWRQMVRYGMWSVLPTVKVRMFFIFLFVISASPLATQGKQMICGTGQMATFLSVGRVCLPTNLMSMSTIVRKRKKNSYAGAFFQGIYIYGGQWL